MIVRWLVLVVAAGAALRFATLDTQSLWYDEAVTAHLLQMDLGAMLRAIPDSESTPPLYYVLAWLWTHVFGTGEVGLRSLSALLGTATIGVVWALGRRLGGERAGLAAAALVAFNPMLVWFSQEARAYALLALLGALSALLWLRALDDRAFVLRSSEPPTSPERQSPRPPTDRAFVLRSSEPPTSPERQSPRPPTFGRRYTRVLAWGATAALLLATHYYAAFLVAPQALWLLWRAPGWRARAAVLVLPVVCAAALAPLAIGQRENDTAAFIGNSELLTRLAQLPKQFLVGYDAPLEALLVAVTALAVLVGFAGLAGLLTGRVPTSATSLEGRRTQGRSATGGFRLRRPEDQIVISQAAQLGAVTLVALALPIVAALAGEDHLITRNVLFALPLACALAGAGLAAAAHNARRPALLALLAACLAGAIVVTGVARDPRLQRDDWRAAVRALGPIDGPRLIVATPGSALDALRYYLPQLRTAAPPTFTTAEIDYVALPVRLPGERPSPPRPEQPVAPAATYALAGRTYGETYSVVRWIAPAPTTEPVAPSPGLDGKAGTLLSLMPPRG